MVEAGPGVKDRINNVRQGSRQPLRSDTNMDISLGECGRIGS